MAKKILIIEDEETLQRSLMEFIKEEGFEVTGASDGQSGLEMAKIQLPDLIILDIILPKIDGFGVLEGIKKDEKTKNIPVILLTNLENQEDIQKAFEKGATTYLVMSDYKLEDVVKKIKETLKM
jgi:two-component system, OmpR family, alkaline phosphatase synthesis response regulator PhoP